MKNGLFKKLIISGVLFLPSSALFALLSMTAETFVVDHYVERAQADVATLRSSIEKEWAQVTRIVDAYQNSPLIQPTGRLDTISAALRAIEQSSFLVGSVSLFDHKQSLTASTNDEFLTFSARGQGVHPGISQWVLGEAMAGTTVSRIATGDYESYVLLPLKNQAGAVSGILALEISLDRLTAMIAGNMTTADLGFRLTAGTETIAEGGKIEAMLSDAKSSALWPRFVDALVVTKQLDHFGEAATAVTLNRDFRPAKETIMRVRLAVLGTSCLTALLFFLGVLWAGSRKPVSGVGVATATLHDGDVRIAPLSTPPSHLEIAAPERSGLDRKAS